MGKVSNFILAATAASLLSAGSAYAVTYYAVPGTGNIDAMGGPAASDRRGKLVSATGPEDASSYGVENPELFYSLGVGGSAWFTFGAAFGQGVGSIFEVTDGRSNYREEVDVYLGTSAVIGDEFNTANYDPAIRVTNESGSGLVENQDFAIPDGIWTHILLIDRSSGGSNRDGFDVDAIKLEVAEAIPEIDAGAGMGSLAALGAVLAFMRTRRRHS